MSTEPAAVRREPAPKQAPSGPPDEVLVVAAILGDLDAFNELVLRYRAAVVRTAQAVVGRGEAEDVAQEALLLAFKALPSIEDPTKFAAWLMAVTRNRALRYDKKQKTRRRHHVELDALLLEYMEALAQPLAPDPDTADELEHALKTIPEAYALPLRLHFLDDMPLKRIAAVMSVPVSTIKWRIHRGKQLMREQIDQD